MNAWLKAHAPKVKEATAYRWMKATEGLLQRTGIADAGRLQTLLRTDSADLPEPERRVQMDLFATLEKTSQAELMGAAPSRRLGGNTYERDGVKGQRGQSDAEQDAVDLWKPLLRDLQREGLDEKSWAHLPDAHLRLLKGLLIDLNKLIPAK